MHIKSTHITAEQYLQDQLQKHTTDPLEDILKLFENQAHTNNTYTQKIHPYTNKSTHRNKTPNSGEDITQINREVNKEQTISDKRVPLNRDGKDKSKDSDRYIRTRYGWIK